MQVNENIRDIQRALGLAADGKRGPVTTAAVLAALDAGRLAIAPAVSAAPIPAEKTPAAALSGDDIPDAGDAKLDGVHPDMVAVVREASLRCVVPFTVNEGLRSIERQKKLVAAGASKTMRSRHLTGHAVDLWPLDPATGKLLPSDAAFPKGSLEAKAASKRLWADLRTIADAVKTIAAERGVALEWGGDWAKFPDGPHFQLSWGVYPR